MGFTPNRKVYVLEFDSGDELHGLEVRTRSVSIGALLKIGSLQEAAADDADPIAQIGAMSTLLDEFGALLVDWNLTDEHDAPVPADAAGLRSMDPEHVMRLIAVWQKAVGQVPSPLGDASPAGAQSAVPPMPMEPLSASRAS